MTWVALDLETDGDQREFALQPWRVESGEARITVFGYASKTTGPRTITTFNREYLSKWLMARAEAKDVIVTANGIFDVAWLLAEGLKTEVFACQWLDMLLLWKRVDGTRYEYNVAEAVKLFYPQFAGYEDGVVFSNIEQAKKKNRHDTTLTLALAIKFWKMLNEQERVSARIEAAGIPSIAESWLHGIQLDQNVLHELQGSLNKQRLESMYQLNDELTKKGLPELDFEDIASPVKLGKVFFKDWGLAPVKETPTGKPSTDKEALIKLAVSNELVSKVIMVRKATNRLNKFVTSPIDCILYNPDSRAHPQPRICGTYTGRMTYVSKQGKGKNEKPVGIALHQWERAKEVRRVIVAPEGMIMFEFDFTGQEMRLAADRIFVMTGDRTMLDLFLDDRDLHSYMGAGIRSVPYEWLVKNKDTDKQAGDIRYLGKFTNLSLQYRVGVPTMRARALTQYGLWLTEHDAVHIKNSYKQTYPGMEDFWKASIRIAREAGYAETMGHRKLMLSNLDEYSQQQTAINFPIQGTGADMKQLAIAAIREPLLMNGGVYGWDLHDALFVYLPISNKAMEIALNLKHRLSNLPYKKFWGWEPSLPLPVDAKYGTRWGELKELK